VGVLAIGLALSRACISWCLDFFFVADILDPNEHERQDVPQIS
jgi:hypothetical protein